MKCFACPQPYHPSSGHLWEGYDDIVYCGSCFRHFLLWMRGHVARRWSKGDFYLAATTSIRPSADGQGLLDQFGEPLVPGTPYTTHPPLVHSEELETTVVEGVF